MSKYLKRVILPIIIVIVAVGAVSLAVMQRSYNKFRQESNQETAALIGLMWEANPNLDPAEIIHLLHNLQNHYSSGDISEREDIAQLTQRGQEILSKYGYLEDDLASNAAQKFSVRTFQCLALTTLAVGVSLAAYFCYKDWRYSQQIRELNHYLEQLSTKAYDLRLEFNSENELSLLSNELYKITVMLREAAKVNRTARRNLETALADISHQLRTPLTSLQVTLDNLYDDPDMPIELRRDFLRSAARQVEDMSDLVMTLLNLAKLDNKTIRMKNAELSARELLGAVEEKVAILADIADVEIALRGDLDAQLKVDPKWQTEALANIVKNCIEHSAAEQTVTISVHDSPLFVRLEIADQGEGIPSGELHHIFERFYRTSNAVEGSVGIGLSFAKAVIEAGGGQITVKSHEGEGTEFRVTFLNSSIGF